jgi:hypothetical protein
MNDTLYQLNQLVKRTEALNAKPPEIFPSAGQHSDAEKISLTGMRLGEALLGIEHPLVQELRILAGRCATLRYSMEGIGEWGNILRDLPKALQSLRQTVNLVIGGDHKDNIEELAELSRQISALGYAGDSNKAEHLRRQTITVSKKLFGTINTYASELEQYPFPIVAGPPYSSEEYGPYNQCKKALLGVLFQILDEVEHEEPFCREYKLKKPAYRITPRRNMQPLYIKRGGSMNYIMWVEKVMKAVLDAWNAAKLNNRYAEGLSWEEIATAMGFVASDEYGRTGDAGRSVESLHNKGEVWYNPSHDSTI